MKEFINNFALIAPAAIRILEILALIICRVEVIKFVRDMLSDDGKILSSRRGIAFGAALTLFDLCINHYKDINPQILWLLVALIVLCLGLATLPEIFDGWGKAMAAIGKFTGKQQERAPAAPAQVNINTEISQPAT